MSSLTIRPAVPGEAGLILELITDLAIFEKMLDEVVATPEMIHEAVFGPEPGCEVVIAEWEGAVAGFALFFNTFSTFVGRKGIHLEDLFVRPEYRGKGIGKALLAYLAKLTKDRNYGRLEWVVLTWNPAREFYAHLGAVEMSEWRTNRLAGPALEALAREAPVV